MYAFSRARLRASSTSFVKPVLVISLAAMLAACSSAKHPAGPQVFSWLTPEPPQPVAIVQAEAELEDDGLPSQAAPAAGIRQMPDDPSAPWSPNYGRSAAGAGDVAASQDAWRAEARGATAPGSVAEDDGLPPIKSPEEAGVMVQPPPRRMQGASLASPWRTCSSADSWKCAR